MIKRQLKTLLFLAFAAVAWQGASAQHTLGFTAGYGMASSRLDPKQEMKAIWGSYTAGLRGAITDSSFSWAASASTSNSCSRDSRWPPTPRWSRRRRITATTRATSIRSCCRSCGSPTSTSSATMSASTSKRRRLSPITSLRPMRTRGRKLRERPTGRATTPSNCRATTAGATDLRAAAVSRC